MKKSVLVWENDIGWCEQIQKVLEKEGILIKEVDSKESLWHSLQEEGCIALVISLEQLLESFAASVWERELYRICQNIRGPVLLLSDKQGNDYELAVLQAGAADYVHREKGIAIFAARLRKSLWKEKDFKSSNTAYLDIYEMLSFCQVQIGQKKIFLTPKEALVFHCFLHRKGEIISRETILTEVWGEQVPECKRVVDTIVKQLRSKIKETQYVIRSKYKLGYFLEKR